MITPLMRELAGPFPSLFQFEEPCFKDGHALHDLIAAWEQVCFRAIQTGSAEELHTAREDYQATLLGHLKIIDGYLMVLSRFQLEYAGLFERVTRTRAELQQHYDSLFPRWQTLDDLESLLLERISLANCQLKALAAKYPPPQTWHNQPDNAPSSRALPCS